MYRKSCLLRYTNNYWLFHSEEVEKQNLSPRDSLSSPWKPSGRDVESWKKSYQPVFTYHPPSTLLHEALCHNLFSVVNTILERGIEVDFRDGLGRTPLSYAAQKGNQAVLKKFLHRREANQNSQEKHGRNPLSYAVTFKDETMMKLLLDKDNIDAELRDSHEWMPLSYAAKSGHEQMARILLERNDVDANGNDPCGRTPLYFAIARNYEAIGKVLLGQKGVELHQRDKFSGRTILHLAWNYGMEAIVELLLERNIEIDAREIRGCTPLSIASQEGWVDIVQLLLS